MRSRERRRVEMRDRMREQTRLPEGLPAPQAVFIDWLISLPPQADLEIAARRQIAIIDASAARHPDVARLRAMLAAVTRHIH